MRSAPQPPTPPEGENERLIFEELMSARAESRPVSRYMLSQKLHSLKGLPTKQAFAVVEVYCENEAPSTPEYLGSEFMAPYFKLSALLCVLLAICVLVYSAYQMFQGREQWAWGFVAAGPLLLMSAAGYIKGLLREFKKD